MKKIGDIMSEMGFRKDAPDSVKEAFLKHLIKNTTGVEIETPSEKMQPKRPQIQKTSPLFAEQKPHAEPIQLSFDFSQSDQSQKAKVS